jgi:hypothetical protein
VLVPHICHSKLLTDWNQDSSSRPAQAKKKFVSSHINGKDPGMVACACHPCYSGKHTILVQTSLGKKQDPISKIIKNNLAQATEYLPSKHKALSSDSSTTQIIIVIIYTLSLKSKINLNSKISNAVCLSYLNPQFFSFDMHIICNLLFSSLLS